MALQKVNPTSPGRRFFEGADFGEITKSEPEKKLVKNRKRLSGRNNLGRITMRRRGGTHKRKYRLLDYRRVRQGVPAKVIGIEYDPNRSARIALIQYIDGQKAYIIAPQGLKIGARVSSGSSADVKPGNTLPLRDIPIGEMLHNIELRPGKGAQMVRAAGTSAQLMAKDGNYALLRLPSGEQRRVLLACQASIGVVGNTEHANRSLGKAGVTRWMGRRPKVRGVAMNPVDHPHGGGEGKTSGGRHPVSPWGTPTKGYKTRKNKRTDKFILRRKK